MPCNALQFDVPSCNPVQSRAIPWNQDPKKKKGLLVLLCSISTCELKGNT
jgi:hypothetical protein